VAKKKQDQTSQEISAEELAEIEALTDHLGPEIEIPTELQEDLDEAQLEEGDETTLELESLRVELETAREEARNNQELYLRALAEMDNLRKRQLREKDEIYKFGNETILREILPVIDNLERAVEHAANQQGGEALLEGVQMTLSQFSSVLKKFGVETLTTIGQAFDPAHHQAVGQLESHELPSNHVAQELQKGYLLNNRLLRPAMVMVAKKAQTATNNEATPAPADNGDE